MSNDRAVENLTRQEGIVTRPPVQDSERMRGIWCAAIAAMVVLVCGSRSARAQFVSGVEDFNGSTFAVRETS